MIPYQINNIQKVHSKYIMTMDRSESKKDNDLPLKLFDPKYKLNVGNMEVRYPVLSQHPKYGSRYMVLDEQPAKEFHGTAKPTIEEMREKGPLFPFGERYTDSSL
jgi:hypothetical protein